MKHETECKTLRGTPIILTGLTKTVGNTTYKQAQMLPVVPQRLEWVRTKNIVNG